MGLHVLGFNHPFILIANFYDVYLLMHIIMKCQHSVKRFCALVHFESISLVLLYIYRIFGVRDFDIAKCWQHQPIKKNIENRLMKMICLLKTQINLPCSTPSQYTHKDRAIKSISNNLCLIKCILKIIYIQLNLSQILYKSFIVLIINCLSTTLQNLE